MPPTETPDMSDALSMDVAAEPPPAGDDMFASAPSEAGEGEPALALGEADETEPDPLFQADAAELFPDFDDEQLTKLQKLIDSRLHATGASV